MDESVKRHEEERKKLFELDEMKLMEEMDQDTLQQLLCDIADMDPDNNMLPVGFRQRDQTTKEATGDLCRNTLMTFLEDQGSSIPDKEEEVPHILGSKKGKEFKEKEKKISDNPYADEVGQGKCDLEPEVEKALANATDLELTDLAAVLGLHKMLNNEQLYEAQNSGGKLVCTESWKANTQCKLKCDVIDESFVNEINLEETMKLLEKNDSSLTDLNLNNLEITREQLLEVIKTLKSNTIVRKFSIANTAATDEIARACGELLAANTALESFNCETNLISAEGIISLIQPLRTNKSLTELKIANQRSKLASKVEDNIMSIMEENNTIKNLGYTFSSAGPRHKVGSFISRNVDFARRQRTGHA